MRFLLRSNRSLANASLRDCKHAKILFVILSEHFYRRWISMCVDLRLALHRGYDWSSCSVRVHPFWLPIFLGCSKIIRFISDPVGHCRSVAAKRSLLHDRLKRREYLWLPSLGNRSKRLSFALCGAHVNTQLTSQIGHYQFTLSGFIFPNCFSRLPSLRSFHRPPVCQPRCFFNDL